MQKNHTPEGTLNKFGEMWGERKGEEKHDREWLLYKIRMGSLFQERHKLRFMEAEMPRFVLGLQIKAGLIWRPNHFSFLFLGNVTIILPHPTSKSAFLWPTENYGVQVGMPASRWHTKVTQNGLTTGHRNRPPCSAQTPGCDFRCSPGLDKNYN